MMESQIIILVILITLFLVKYSYDQLKMNNEIKQQRKTMVQFQHIASGDICWMNKKYLDLGMMNEYGWKRME